MTWRGLDVVEWTDESGPSVDELLLLRRSKSFLCRSMSMLSTLKPTFDVSMSGAG
jgi:hypothetical protein